MQDKFTLQDLAVARQSGANATTIMQGYLATSPQMAQNHTAAPAAQKQPSAPGMAPGGQGGSGGGAQQGKTAARGGQNTAVIDEYEVFRNGKNALAFFFYRTPALDRGGEAGPFWFSIQEDKIVAGTQDGHVVFEDVDPAILAAARHRGNVQLVEFKDQKPVRCTPCYLSDKLTDTAH